MTDWRNLDKAEFPKHLHSAVDDVNYFYSEEYQRPLELMKASPQHLWEGIDKFWHGQDSIKIWRGSEGYTKTWSDGQCGFVAHD
jgi:hypothetical protein